MEEEGFINGYDEDDLLNSLPPPTDTLIQQSKERDQREQQQRQQVIQHFMQIETTQNIPDNQIHREETLPPMNIQQVPIHEPNPNTLIVPRHDGEQILLDRTELTKLGYVMNIKSDLLFSDQNRIINDYALAYDDDFIGNFNIYYCAPKNGKLGYYATNIGIFIAQRLLNKKDKILMDDISSSIPRDLRNKTISYWSLKCDAQRYFMFYYLFYYCTDIEEFDVQIVKKYQDPDPNNEEEMNVETITKFDLRREFTKKGFCLKVTEKGNNSNTVTRFMYFSCTKFSEIYYFNFATNFITKLPAVSKKQPTLEITFIAKMFDSGYLRLYESLRSIFWMNKTINSFFYLEFYCKNDNEYQNIQRKYYLNEMSKLNPTKFIKQQKYPDDDPEKYPGIVKMNDSIFNSQSYLNESIIINDYALAVINMTRHGYQQPQQNQEQLQYNIMDNNVDTISTQQNKPEKSMEEINMHE